MAFWMKKIANVYLTLTLELEPLAMAYGRVYNNHVTYSGL